MPELPEAETIVRTLRRHIEGKRIIEARFLTARVSRDRPEQLEGRLIRRLRRHGKNVLLELDEGVLLVDLRMTGRLLVDGTRGPYTRAMFRTDGASLVFDDVRQFGSLRLMTEAPADVGPDALEIGAGEFAARLKARDTEIKKLLLDQKFVRGLGNIYADEILFRAGIHPRARTRKLGAARVKALHKAMAATLEEAIAAGGSSVSDYVDGEGRKGGFQLHHQVYRKQGQPCPRCGGAIRRIEVGQRGTHYCARCQR